ncbi:unnamed protein product [Calicophoron daubneyi]|uniref:Oxysterol-binding protein n=1 Tax=Calicophoron daubneyi TaxID=300641 RepID=A0AAV2SWH5_CALDB
MGDRDQEHLKRLIKRAKELQIEEEKSMLRKRIEGQLLKFTNMVKGYQYRWCVIDPDAGTVEYYEKEDHKHSSKPRGILNLTYASVCPSDEDSQAFVINAANGDALRLKAADAKERQYWVNRLRAVAEYHSERAEHHPLIATLSGNVANENGTGLLNTSTPSANQSLASVTPTTSSNSTSNSIKSTEKIKSATLGSRPENNSTVQNKQQTVMIPSTDTVVTDMNVFPQFCPGGSSDPRAQLRELFRQLEMETQCLANAVDSASVRSPELTTMYKTLLLSKATSQATLSCLKRCLDFIKRREIGNAELASQPLWVNTDSTRNQELEVGVPVVNHPGLLAQESGCGGDDSPRGSQESAQPMEGGVFPSPILNMDSQALGLPDLPGDSQPDPPFDESELGSVEDQKHIVLHILSQLKLGMDLTRIVLPTFILEKRSLLEMFADYMAHPDLFLNITCGKTPEDRMLAFVQWYLTAFHSGRKDKIAKKPYNPIIGESFHCCWLATPSSTEVTQLTNGGQTKLPVPDNSDQTAEQSSTNTDHVPVLITYCAEQVSHHPPITALHIECPSYQMELDFSVHVKSKFGGMSISAAMVGKNILRLGEHDNEEYHFSLPTAYARSILTTPWVELGDKVSITCPQTGYSASVAFHTKPMRSNKLHRVSGEIFAPHPVSGTATTSATSLSSSDKTLDPNLVARVSGEWNNVLEFEQLTQGGKKWTIDVNRLPVLPKRVRPIVNQRPEESRCLWQHVTDALKMGNIQLATEKKRELEERQRASEKYRVRHRIPFPVKYFQWDGTAWVFRRPAPKIPTPDTEVSETVASC